MSRIDVTLVGNGACRIVHQESGASIASSVAPEYGGAGGAFSSTDLLAAALGSCIATNLEPLLVRHGIPLDTIRVGVDKELSVTPKRLVRLAVAIHLGPTVSPDVIVRLGRAADHCLVHQSLAPEIDVRIDLTSDPQ